MSEVDLRELGSSGLKRQGGVVYEEYLPQLTGSRWFNKVREMSDYPIISAMHYTVEMQIRRVTWQTKAANESRQARKAYELVDSCFNDMSFTWADTISEALPFLYGHSVLELCYKIRNGEKKDASGLPSSQYDDGLIGWRKWAPRSQETLEKWEFDKSGGINGVWQNDPYGDNQSHLLPIDKMLLFRTTSKNNNPEGRSILRGAYEAYYYAKTLKIIQGILYSRLNGLPVFHVPSQILSASATAAQQAILTEIKDIVVNLHVDEQMGMILPSDRDEHGHLRYWIEMLRADVGPGFDIEETIIRNEQRILGTMLAQFILTGHEGTSSSRALSTNEIDMFWMSVDGHLDSIGEVVNRYAIPRLMRLNGFAREHWPRRVHDSVERIDLDKLGQYIVRLASSGVDFSTNLDIQQHLAQQANLPIDELKIVPVVKKPSTNGTQPVDATKQRNNGTVPNETDGKA